jgi:hypothetical protein
MNLYVFLAFVIFNLTFLHSAEQPIDVTGIALVEETIKQWIW